MKKRVVLPTLCFAVLSSAAFAKSVHADTLHTSASVMSSKKQIQYVAVNKGSFLNMRSSASVKASVLSKLSAGTPVTVLSASKDWSKIVVNGKTGYISSQYLIPSNGTPSKTTAKPSSNIAKSSAVKSVTKYVNVLTGSMLNMRSSSSTKASVIAWLKKGTAVKVLSDSKGWSKVQVNGKTGYVSRQYLTAAKPAASISSAKPKTTQASSSAKISSISMTDSVKTAIKYVNVPTSSTLNLRNSGSTKASVIAWLKKGTAVTVLSDSKGWSRVQMNGKIGYVSSRYLTAAQPIASGNTAKTTTPVKTSTSGTATPSKTTPPVRTVAKYVKVETGGRLNVRASGSTKASVIGTLANNTAVTVVSESNGWAKVQANGKTGYVSSQFLMAAKPAGSSSGASTPVKTVTKYVAVAGGSFLNVRSSAGMNGGILAGLTQGTKVVVLSEAKGWSKIQAKGITGYVGTQYLSTSVPKQVKTVPIPRYVSAASLSGVSMYTKPSENSSVIAKLAKGVQVLVQSESNGWSDIQAYGREGYVKTALLTDVKPTGNKETDSNNGSAGDSQDVIKYVDVDGKSNLNMRDSASPTGNILSKLARGTAVKILEETNGWSKVTANGKMGYVSSQYLSEDLAAPPGLINGSKTFTYKQYTLSLNDMVNIEMKATPQTDRQYNTYLRDDALKLNNPSKPTSGVVQGDNWNVRGGPGTSFWKVSQVCSGTVLNILSAVKGSDGHIWYQVKLNQTWVNASPDDVKYYLDPSNFENDPIKSYQFLDLSASTNLQADEVNSRILSGKGILAGKASSFIQAGQTLHINEIYLIAHALLETGNGLSQLANGVQVNGKTVYNMYGIGAYDSDALHSGAQFAYNAGWFTPEQAIIGGAQFIAQDYIDAGQNTLYKMRWNPDAAQTSNRAAHQYATDIGWADKQIVQMQNLYSLVSSYTLAYDVPMYK